MQKVTPEILAELKAKHGADNVIYLDSEEENGEAIFRGANRFEQRRYLDELADPEKRSRATEPLVYSCLLWPSLDEFEALINRRPFLIQSFGTEIVKFSGSRQVVVKKK